MSTSIALFRQQLPRLIEAAQRAPQVITKHDAPVAVLVSPAYFERAQKATAALPVAGADSFYARLMQLRAAHPQEAGPELSALVGERSDRLRANPFAQPPKVHTVKRPV